MKRKELTKTYMMISIWKKTFGCDVFYKLIQRFRPKGKIHYVDPIKVII